MFARAGGNRAITRAERVRERSWERSRSLRSDFAFAPVNSVADLRHRKRHRRYRSLGRSVARVDIPANLCHPFFADTPD